MIPPSFPPFPPPPSSPLPTLLPPPSPPEQSRISSYSTPHAPEQSGAGRAGPKQTVSIKTAPEQAQSWGSKRTAPEQEKTGLDKITRVMSYNNPSFALLRACSGAGSEHKKLGYNKVYQD